MPASHWMKHLTGFALQEEVEKKKKRIEKKRPEQCKILSTAEEI